MERVRLKVRKKEAVASFQALLVESIKDPQVCLLDYYYVASFYGKIKKERGIMGEGNGLRKWSLVCLISLNVVVIEMSFAGEFKSIQYVLNFN